MSQLVTLENGETHEFPDEATADQITRAIHGDKFKQVTGIDQPSFGQNFTGGLVHGLQQMLPDLSKANIPYVQANSTPPKDGYEMFGTKDMPYNTVPGAEQLLGELFTPGKAASGAVRLAKSEELIPKLIDKFSPNTHANNLVSELTQGARNSEDLGSSIANDIRGQHDQRLAQANAFTQHPLDLFGDTKIYNTPNPLISTELDKGKRLMGTVKDIPIGDLYDSFKANPTFKNGHKLQSQLGVMIGDLQKIPRSFDTANQISSIAKARDLLKNDMFDFLGDKEKEVGYNLKDMYKRGSDFYRDNVVPYLSSKKLRDINIARKTNVKNIHTEFNSPYDVQDPLTGQTNKGPINKILEDLPEQTKGKILGSKVGVFSDVKDSTKLADKIKSSLEGGYSKYEPTGLQKSLADMLDKQRNLDTLKKGLGWAGNAAGVGGVTGAIGGGIYHLLSK